MKRFTFLLTALLFAFFAIPLGTMGQTTETLNIEAYATANSWTNGTQYLTATVGDVTFTAAGGNNTGKYYSSGNNWRFYQNESATLTISVPDGNTLTSITPTFSASNNGTLLNGSTALTSGSAVAVSGTSVTFSLGNSGTATNGQIRFSNIAVSYTDGDTPTPTTYTVTYDCNGGTSGCPDNATGITAGTSITLADAPTKTDYTFDGWNDGTTTYDAGDSYTVNGNVTMTAQWTENSGGGGGGSDGDEQWVLANLADLSPSDVIVIVGNNGSNYAMSNNNGTEAAPTAVAVTVSGITLTGTIANNIQWTISGNATDGYTFYPNGSTTTWLYCNNGNNGVRVGENTNNVFTITDDYLYNTATSRYVGIYNSADWRCYTSINNNIKDQTFAFYKKITDGVLPPSITAANVDIAYDAVSGAIEYTINNGVSGGSLAATTDSEWLTIGTVGETVPFTCSANEEGTERSATVTLTYTYNAKETVTKNVTVTQDGNPNNLMTIAEVRTQGTGEVATKGIVTSCAGTTGYIQDASAAICVHGASLTVGDEIRVSGTLSTYNGLLEITSPEVTVLSSGNTVEPQVMTIADINASANQGWLVRVENATVSTINSKSVTIAQGENTIVARFNDTNDITFAVNDIVSMTANIGCYSTTQLANPTNIEVQANEDPVINVEDVTLAYDATSGEIAYTIDNPVAGAALTATTDAAWISDVTVGNTAITFTTTANEGTEDRTAIFTLSYEGAENKTVNVTQTHYTVDYAELPFEFDGGKGDIDTIAGLTQSGLGSYANSPKLKFDTTDDYLILKFNERPGILSFDIKGNTFSGGTFTVQTSEDGVTYTDLENYTDTNFDNTLHSEEFTTLDENVRYIKWIYTNKASGNVALGNIVLQEYKELQEYMLTIPTLEHVTVTANYGDNSISNGDFGSVMEGTTVELTLELEDGYQLESLTVAADNEEEVEIQTTDNGYSFEMPASDATINATAEPITVNNIVDITAVGNYTVQGTIVAISNRGFILGDGTGYIYYFGGSNFSSGNYNIGEKWMLSGEVVAYGGVFEFKNTTTPVAATTSNYVADEPTVLTGTEMDALVTATDTLLSAYVQYEGVLNVSGTYYNVSITGASTAIGSISYPMDTEFAELSGKTVKVTGYYVGCSSNKYYNTMIGTIEEVEGAAPVINAEDVTLAYNATSGEISYTVTNAVEGQVLTATATADWISDIAVTDAAVTFTTTANDGTEDRTATFTLSYEGAEDKTVTVTQSKYEIDYAELPFEFDGGKGDIDTIVGLTQSGLGSYANSPKLKFDTTDDYLILKFNERPGTLSFDIKGNGFSGGTFTVQTSVDGENWTDLQSYTELGDTQEEEFNALDAEIRYIRWYYTNKDNGNVALGNIKLDAYVEPQEFTLTIGNPEHVTITASYGTASITNGGSMNVMSNTEVTLTATVEEGYALDNIEAVTDDEEVIDLISTETENVWTFYMPFNAVTVNAEASSSQAETINYTLATTIESGRHYIIVGFDGDEAFAMGMQNSNNRAAVGITTNGNAAVFSSEDGVYEFVINGPDAEGNYIIYDNEKASTGYLFAPSSSSNYLRTETYLDANKNGKWSIEIDTVTTIKAQGSSTRNWMRFNSGSSIFSCYGETSNQKDIHLYVRDEEENYEFVTDVKGYGEENNHWQLIASPLNGETDPATAVMFENEYDLYAFDPTENGKEWRNGKALTSFNLANGTGYLYANSADATIHFIGQANTDGNVTLNKTNDEHGAWNLVGNPFGYATTIDRSFYVMNEEGSEIVVDTLGIVNPMQGIFVIAESDGETLTFAPADNGAKNERLILTLSHDGQDIDYAVVRFDNSKSLAKYTLNDESTTIYFTEEGSDYAVINAGKRNELSVNINAKGDASYTISVKPQDLSLDYLHLIDTLTGEDIDLLETQSYSFKTTDNELINRFKINFF